MAKTSKSGKANRKAVEGGMIAVVVVIVLIVIGYFVYISGILPRTLTGVGITETLADGSTRTVKNFSVLETNFHFKEVYNTYSNYGMVSEDNLNMIYDEESGETYRDWLLREVASQMRTLALIERAAKNSDFIQYSKAREYAAYDIDTIDFYAKMYGASSGQQFLASQYGTGMTKRTYIDYNAREALVQEYAYYLRQFDPAIVPTDEQVQAKFDENPSIYNVLDCSTYFIQCDKDDAGAIIGLADAQAAANKIASAAKDTASFRKAVMDYLKETGNEEALASFDDDADPTFRSGFTYTQATYLEADLKDYLFADDSKAGEAKVISADDGVYVAFIADKRLNEIKTVDYRMLTLAVETEADATEEEIAQAAQDRAAEAATYCTEGLDSLSFYNVVKNHTTDRTQMLDGGFVSGATVDQFVSTDDNPLDSAQMSAGQWLFDSSRKQGDIKIVISDDQKTVYVYYFETVRPTWQYTVRNDIITANFNEWNTNIETSTDPKYVVNSGLIETFIY